MFAPQPLDDYDSGVGTSTKLPLDVSYSKVEVAARGLNFPVFNQDAKTIVQSGSQIVIGSVFDPNIQNPYTMNLYLGMERQLTSSIMIESALVGNRGVKFRLLRNYNNVDRVTGIRPNPDLGQGMYFSSDQDTVYYSWQTSVRKRYTRNLTGGFITRGAKLCPIPAETQGRVSAATPYRQSRISLTAEPIADPQPAMPPTASTPNIITTCLV